MATICDLTCTNLVVCIAGQKCFSLTHNVEEEKTSLWKVLFCPQSHLKIRSIKAACALREENIGSTKSSFGIYRQTSHFNHTAAPRQAFVSTMNNAFKESNLFACFPPDKNSRKPVNLWMQKGYTNKSNANRQGYKFALHRYWQFFSFDLFVSFFKLSFSFLVATALDSQDGVLELKLCWFSREVHTARQTYFVSPRWSRKSQHLGSITVKLRPNPPAFWFWSKNHL